MHYSCYATDTIPSWDPGGTCTCTKIMGNNIVVELVHRLCIDRWL